ncbi:signal transduction protein [Kouleothrix aurantiaca]|jgi:CBS domain-containing protein/rubredoxin|uniref:Signal transduction protein n=1 Tax=Kouleothrix aurantiaca TaxID=186479 RepID=A0A0N8PRQ8_9CHLR|nr:signal transduction protein [Kouleothrix aurantiaca]
MQVREIMTSDVISVPENNTIEDAARVLARHRISGLPVVNEAGALVGLVTEYDFISKQGATVADIMSRGVISVTEDTDVEEVAHLLANRRIRRVPVLRGDRLIGIVSRSDLIKQIAMRWVCPVCGEVVRGPEAPEQCPRCHAPKSVFTHETMHPGM